MSSVVLIKAIRHSLDNAEGGYGFISPHTIIEYDKNKAADLVARGVFEYVNLPPSVNYFTKMEHHIGNKAIVAEPSPEPMEVKVKGKNKK